MVLTGWLLAAPAWAATGNANAATITETKTVDTHEDAFSQMELLAQVLLQVRKHYVEERSYEELLQGAIRGMLGGLDPHSAFLDAEEYENLMDETSGSYGGIGIQIGIRDNALTVIAPIEDTPAFRAGIQSGDRITAINGESTSGITLREAVRLLRGPKGEAVRITIMAKDAGEEQEVKIVRARIEITSIKGARVLRHGVGYIRMTQFDTPSSTKLLQAMQELQKGGMKALVLDLRGNPGGLLDQAIKVSSLLLPEGKTIVSTRGRETTKGEIVFTASGGAFPDLPLVVLVNRGSASAAEIVAGAIQDHKRGILIGETTYGKGSVQSVIRMGEKRDSAIRLTTSYYYTPAQRLIHDKGIAPDIEVTLGREEWRRVQIRRAHLESPDTYLPEEVAEYSDVVDRQLERAIDLLEALLIYRQTSDA